MKFLDKRIENLRRKCKCCGASRTWRYVAYYNKYIDRFVFTCEYCYYDYKTKVKKEREGGDEDELI